jgi:hypothetical protein
MTLVLDILSDLEAEKAMFSSKSFLKPESASAAAVYRYPHNPPSRLRE